MLFVLAGLAALAQDPGHVAAANYVNAIHFDGTTDQLRRSFDRWDAVIDSAEDPDQFRKDIQGSFFVYGAQYDLNAWAQDPSGQTIAPQSFGLAMGSGRVRYYAVGAHTDPFGKTGLGYFRVAGGLNADLSVLSIQTEASFGTGEPQFYAKGYVPMIRTHFDIGLDRFETSEGPEGVAEDGTFAPNRFGAGTSALKVVSLGAVLRRPTRTLKPEIHTSLSSAIPYENWDGLPIDAELHLSATMEDYTDLSDVDARASVYVFASKKPLLFDDEFHIMSKPAWIASVSYRTRSVYADQLKQAGLTQIDEQSGFGFEGGFGLRVLGFTEYGFPDATYVKLVFFNNYSAYFDTLPNQVRGIKLKVNY